MSKPRRRQTGDNNQSKYSHSKRIKSERNVSPRFTCTYCGKQAFKTRKDAREFYKHRFKQEPNLRAYECRDAPIGTPGHWHFGHNSEYKDRGKNKYDSFPNDSDHGPIHSVGDQE